MDKLKEVEIISDKTLAFIKQANLVRRLPLPIKQVGGVLPGDYYLSEMKVTNMFRGGNKQTVQRVDYAPNIDRSESEPVISHYIVII